MITLGIWTPVLHRVRVARARRLPRRLPHRVQRHDEGLGVHDRPFAGRARTKRGGTGEQPGNITHRNHGLLHQVSQYVKYASNKSLNCST